MVSSLRGRMNLLFLAFFVLVSISVAATAWTIETQKQDALVINLAGRQRMLVQRMAKDALQIEQAKDTARILDLQEAARIFEETLRALITGGQAPYLPDRTVSVPAAQRPDVLAGLHQVQRTWEAFRGHLEVITTADPGSPGFTEAVQAVERLSPDLAQEADDVVRMYESASAHKVARLRWIQVAFFASALVLLAVGSLVTQKSVLGPLRTLGSVAERIGAGDLNTPVELTGPREIQVLARSFEVMRAQIKGSREELLAWTEELETRVAQRTRELVALYEVSREISSRLDINHVLRSVTDKARELLGGDVAALCLLDEAERVLILQAHSGPQEVLAQARAPAQGQPAALVLEAQEAVRCGADDCAGACAVLLEPYRVSHLAAPLRVGERVIGALCVGSFRPACFSPDEEHLLTRLASSAAIALENARLYQQAERVATLEERQRIAAEMHDGLAQTLSYLDLKAERVVELVEAGQGDAARREMQRIRDAIGQASQEVRCSIARLQEGRQPRLTLQGRLAELVAELAGDGGPPVALLVELQPPMLLPPDVAEQVLRVVREALLNARRHAQAERIAVRLEQQGTGAMVVVEDDGRGFDPEAPPADGSGHFGLSIMRARAARIGGQLTVHSSPGQGTRVMLRWPTGDGGRKTKDE